MKHYNLIRFKQKAKQNGKFSKCQENKHNISDCYETKNKKSEAIRLLTIVFIGFILISFPCFAWEGIERYLDIQYVNHIDRDNSPIILQNNPDAVNPTYEELMNFLKKAQPNSITNSHSLVYAQKLHDNAEKAGYRCAWVSVHLADGEDHACNAFNTKDKGVVFLDCAGRNSCGNWDSFVNVEIGKQYVPKDPFHGSLIYNPAGIIDTYEMYW